MGVANGIQAAVKVDAAAATTVRKWRTQWRENSPAMYASDTQGGPMRIQSVTDFRGAYTAYGAFPDVFPGETFQFKGLIETQAGTDGVDTGVNGAICREIEIAWEQEKGLGIAYMVQFDGNGALTFNADTDVSDGGDPNPPTSVSMTILDDAVAITDVRSVKLKFKAANRPYSSSDTSGQMRRTPGNVDGSIVYSAYVNAANLAALEAMKGNLSVWKLNVNATDYWEVTWFRITGVNDLGADREGAENVFVTVTGEFTGFLGTVSGAGSIKSGNAGANTHWP